MIPSFLFRVVQAAILFLSVAFVLWIAAFLLNRTIQFVAEKAGWEVRDFSEWLWNLVPKKQPKQTCPQCQARVPKKNQYCGNCGNEL